VSAPFFRALAREAAASYPRGDRFARHFARGKLAGDPAFAHLLRAGLVPDGARVLDLGSGQGVLAALLLAARARLERGGWPAACAAPPALARYTGIELMARDVERARAMAAHWAPADRAPPHAAGATKFIEGDIRTTEFPHCDVAVILDVLHYVDYEAQSDVLARVRAALARGGVLLLRVGDESPGLRFRYTVFLDRLVMRLRGHRLPRLWCRPAAAWRAELERMGFKVQAAPMSAGTAFANVLLVAKL
jgi:SAM-dependent methyltransferase